MFKLLKDSEIMKGLKWNFIAISMMSRKIWKFPVTEVLWYVDFEAVNGSRTDWKDSMKET